MSSFDTYNWSENAQWKSYVSNLYIPEGPDYDRLLNNRKQRWYKEHVDSTYEIQQQASSSSSQSTTQTNTTNKPNVAPQSNTTQSSSPRSSSSNPSSSTSQTNGFGWNIAKITSYAQLGLHSISMILSIFLILPFLSSYSSSIAFSGIVISSMIAMMISLVRSYGRPQINQQYAIKLARDENSHYLFYSLILFAASHSIIYVIPLIVRSTLFVCAALPRILPQYNAALYNKVEAPLAMLTQQVMLLQRSNAMFEIVALGYSLMMLFTSERSFVWLLLQMQYLRIRAMISPDSQSAWQQVAAIFDSLINKPFVPQLIRTVYYKARTFISRNSNPAPAR